MAALKAAVELFKDSLSDICPTGQIQSLTADGDAVAATFADVEGKRLRLSLTYLEPESYPRSGCLVLLEDQENRYAERISSLSERFQDNAALATVLSKVSLHSSAVGTSRLLQLLPVLAARHPAFVGLCCPGHSR